MPIEAGSQVVAWVRVTHLDTGEVYDPGEGGQRRQPLRFTVGDGTVLVPFENQLLGMDVGEEKTFNLPNPYGAHNPADVETRSKATDVDPDIPDAVEDDEVIEIRASVPRRRRITRLVGDQVDVDANLFADTPMTFEVKIVTVL